MPTKLKNLVITKVALVDEGSCSAAHIKLYKRKEKGGSTMKTLEEILKSLPEEEKTTITAEIEKAKKSAADEAKAKTQADMEDMMDGGIDDALENPDGTPKADTKNKSVAKVANKIKELNAEIVKLKEDPTGKSEEDLLKSVDPAVRALIEKSRNAAAAANAAILKMKDEQDTAEAIAKVKELPNIGGKVEDLAKSFKAIKGSNAEAFKAVFSVLKAADAMIADGNPLGSTGTSAGGAEDFAKAADAAWNKIEEAAETIRKSANCSKEVAISKAINENPKLYQDYLDNLK